MFGFTHLMDDGLVGLALLAVLILFLGSVVFGICVSLWPARVSFNQNSTYVATAIAGLVLTVASGVLGKPATVQLSTPPTTSGVATHASVQATFSDDQTGEFQKMYAWSYILAGLLCIVVFMFHTPAKHDLVKSVALTTLGFLVTIVGGLATKPPPTLANQGYQGLLNELRPESQIIIQSLEPKNSVLF